MSAAAPRLGPWRGGRAGAAPLSAERSDVLHLVAFAALAAFASVHWAGLVSDPPGWRMVLAVLVATATGAALVALGRSSLPRPAIHALALCAVVAGGALALMATGLPARLLPPGRWDDLGSELDRGLTGIRTVTWPYSGPEAWVRLVILLGAPLFLTVAAALSFWPARRGARVLRALGLSTLLLFYGMAVTNHDPGAPLSRGLILFLIVAAWLWLPRVRPRDALAGAALVLGVGILALPAAARLDADVPVIDYRAWNWFGGRDITFDWNHTYGPLAWPREGTTLLNVKSRRPLYWKAETLDTFDGLRWIHSASNDHTSPLGEVPENPDPRWDRSIRVTVRSLRTDFVIGAGTPYRITGAGDAVNATADGTVRRLDEPLRRGDSYTVRSYDPTPSPRELRAAPAHYHPEMVQYTRLALPSPGEDALGNPADPRSAAGSIGLQAVMPLVGSGVVDPDAARALRASPYARSYRLARRLTAGAPTVYDAVRRVEDHLGRGYTYSERPPTHRYPLESFLFSDRTGYCQQFSGAMALLLRMSGIPSRVVSGFSPGSLNRDTGEYRVRDLDAHSWVEVYFAGIGWVTFDPTPPAAPATRAGLGPDPGRAGAAGAGDTSLGGDGTPAPDHSPGAAASGGGGGGEGGPSALLVALIAAALMGVATLVFRTRAAGGRDGASAEAGLRELERALPRLGWALPAGTTLLQLERRLRRAAGPASGRYVERLRQGRFAVASPPAGRTDRRAVRRELTAGGGPLTRLRGYRALPPGRPGV